MRRAETAGRARLQCFQHGGLPPVDMRVKVGIKVGITLGIGCTGTHQ